MESEKIVHSVFMILLCAILMSTLYMVFFGTKNWEGVLFYSSRQMEYPISKYYYSYCYLPNVHMEDAIDESLGGSLHSNYSNLMNTEADLSLDDSDNSTFGTSYHHYSSGWN